MTILKNLKKDDNADTDESSVYAGSDDERMTTNFANEAEEFFSNIQ